MAIPNAQKALVIPERYGTPEVKDVPVLRPGKGEILVKINSTSLNPVDWKVAKLDLLRYTYPISLGRDIAGVVVAVGEHVQDFVIGGRVFAQATGNHEIGRSAFAEYSLLPTNLTGKIPEGISDDVAATFPVVLFTGITGLYNKAPRGWGLDIPFGEGRGKYSNFPLVVLGGSGSVGQIVIQLGKLSGFSPIITTASVRNEAALKNLGADYVIERNLPEEEILSSIRKAVSKRLISHVFDSISSAQTQLLGVQLLSAGGRLGIILPVKVGDQIQERKVILSTPDASAWLPHNAEIAPIFFHEWADELLRIIKPNRIEVLPDGINSVVAGLERMQKGEISGVKLVVHPHETPA